VDTKEQPFQNGKQTTTDMDILAAMAVLEQPPAGDILRAMVDGVRAGQSTNQIHATVGGNRQRVYEQVKVIRQALGGVQ
jgi:hypothetical protein